MTNYGQNRYQRLPKVTRVLGRFDLLEEQLGWIIRVKDGVKVKVRRIIAKDEKTRETRSLTTNDLESFGIHQRKNRRTSCKTLGNSIG